MQIFFSQDHKILPEYSKTSFTNKHSFNLKNTHKDDVHVLEDVEEANSDMSGINESHEDNTHTRRGRRSQQFCVRDMENPLYNITDINHVYLHRKILYFIKLTY